MVTVPAFAVWPETTLTPVAWPLHETVDPSRQKIFTLIVPAGTLEMVPLWSEHDQLAVATVCPDESVTEALMVVIL
jgi:hypothetical protein